MATLPEVIGSRPAIIRSTETCRSPTGPKEHELTVGDPKAHLLHRKLTAARVAL